MHFSDVPRRIASTERTKLLEKIGIIIFFFSLSLFFKIMSNGLQFRCFPLQPLVCNALWLGKWYNTAPHACMILIDLFNFLFCQ